MPQSPARSPRRPMPHPEPLNAALTATGDQAWLPGVTCEVAIPLVEEVGRVEPPRRASPRRQQRALFDLKFRRRDRDLRAQAFDARRALLQARRRKLAQPLLDEAERRWRLAWRRLMRALR
jgi:hypothetical protein